MQTTLDCINTPSAKLENLSLNFTDEHQEYFYQHFSEAGIVQHQIEQHLAEEKAEMDEIKEADKFLQQFEGFKPKIRPQKFIRVGKKC